MRQTHIFVFCRFALQYRRREGENAMKSKKQEKRYLALDYYEWKELVNGINQYRKQVIDEGGYVDFINEILLKLINAPTKKIRIMEDSK